MVIRQPCKHCHSESINKKLALWLTRHYVTITTNILVVSKLKEIHLITKNAQSLHHLPSRAWGHQTCILLLLRLCTGIIDNCVLLSAALWTVSGQELFLVVTCSECAALRRGMLCRQNCVLLLCVLTLSANNWKLACSKCAALRRGMLCRQNCLPLLYCWRWKSQTSEICYCDAYCCRCTTSWSVSVWGECWETKEKVLVEKYEGKKVINHCCFIC